MAAAPDSVLIIKPSSLGDVVHTLPAVHRLRQAWPGADIRWIVNTEWAPLLAGNPDIDGVIEFPRSRFRGLAGIPKMFRWAAGLSSLQPDLALDFQGLFRSGLFARASRARRILCLGNAEFLNRASAHTVVPMEPDEHAVDRYLRIPAALGISGGAVNFPLPDGEPPPSGVTLPGRFLLLHPFSRGEGKSLTAEQVVNICAALPGTPIVLAGRADIDLPNLPGHALNLLNRTSLAQLIWLIRRADFVVSVDSGPMHIAAAITPNLLSIHTWSDPRRVGPYNPDAWLWKAGEILRKRDLDSGLAARREPFRNGHLRTLVNFLTSRLRPKRADA